MGRGEQRRAERAGLKREKEERGSRLSALPVARRAPLVAFFVFFFAFPPSVEERLAKQPHAGPHAQTCARRSGKLKKISLADGLLARFSSFVLSQRKDFSRKKNSFAQDAF